MSSSNASPTCRIEWRPSRGLAIAIGSMGGLAAVSLQLSALPTPVAIAGAGIALAYSAYLARRELRREPFTLVWAGGEATAELNFTHHVQSLTGARLYIRRPLAALKGVDISGRTQRYLWWPDTLPSSGRRQLRLLDQVRMESQIPASSSHNR